MKADPKLISRSTGGRRAGDTKVRILDAAERLFLSKGYEGVRIRDLTEAAGVNVAAINYHFMGKKNLYREVIRRRISKIARPKLEALRECIEAKDGRQDLRGAIKGYVSSFLGEMLKSKEAGRFMKIMSAEMGEDGVATDLIYKEIVLPVHTVLKEVIAKARPGMSERRAALCITSISGQMIHFARARAVVKRSTGRSYDREFIEEIVEHITDFSMGGIG